MPKVTVSTEDIETQTILQCFPHNIKQNELANVQTDEACQTAISFNPFSSNTDLYPKLTHLSSNDLFKDIVRIILIPRKVRLQWKLPDILDENEDTVDLQEEEELNETIELLPTDENIIASETEETMDNEKPASQDQIKLSLEISSARDSSTSQVELHLKGVLKRSTDSDDSIRKKHKKEQADTECQTNLSVAPHFLDFNETAIVSTDHTVQTSITCIPQESISALLPKLRSYLTHEGTPVDALEPSGDKSSVLEMIKSLIDQATDKHFHMFDPAPSKKQGSLDIRNSLQPILSLSPSQIPVILQSSRELGSAQQPEGNFDTQTQTTKKCDCFNDPEAKITCSVNVQTQKARAPDIPAQEAIEKDNLDISYDLPEVIDSSCNIPMEARAVICVARPDPAADCFYRAEKEGKLPCTCSVAVDPRCPCSAKAVPDLHCDCPVCSCVKNELIKKHGKFCSCPVCVCLKKDIVQPVVETISHGPECTCDKCRCEADSDDFEDEVDPDLQEVTKSETSSCSSRKRKMKGKAPDIPSKISADIVDKKSKLSIEEFKTSNVPLGMLGVSKTSHKLSTRSNLSELHELTPAVSKSSTKSNDFEPHELLTETDESKTPPEPFIESNMTATSSISSTIADVPEPSIESHKESAQLDETSIQEHEASKKATSKVTIMELSKKHDFDCECTVCRSKKEENLMNDRLKPSDLQLYHRQNCKCSVCERAKKKSQDQDRPSYDLNMVHGKRCDCTDCGNKRKFATIDHKPTCACTECKNKKKPKKNHGKDCVCKICNSQRQSALDESKPEISQKFGNLDSPDQDILASQPSERTSQEILASQTTDIVRSDSAVQDSGQSDQNEDPSPNLTSTLSDPTEVFETAIERNETEYDESHDSDQTDTQRKASKSALRSVCSNKKKDQSDVRFKGCSNKQKNQMQLQDTCGTDKSRYQTGVSEQDSSSQEAEEYYEQEDLSSQKVEETSEYFSLTDDSLEPEFQNASSKTKERSSSRLSRKSDPGQSRGTTEDPDDSESQHDGEEITKLSTESKPRISVCSSKRKSIEEKIGKSQEVCKAVCSNKNKKEKPPCQAACSIKKSPEVVCQAKCQPKLMPDISLDESCKSPCSHRKRDIREMHHIQCKCEICTCSVCGDQALDPIRQLNSASGRPCVRFHEMQPKQTVTGQDSFADRFDDLMRVNSTDVCNHGRKCICSVCSSARSKTERMRNEHDSETEHERHSSKTSTKKRTSILSNGRGSKTPMKSRSGIEMDSPASRVSTKRRSSAMSNGSGSSMETDCLFRDSTRKRSTAMGNEYDSDMENASSKSTVCTRRRYSESEIDKVPQRRCVCSICSSTKQRSVYPNDEYVSKSDIQMSPGRRCVCSTCSSKQESILDGSSRSRTDGKKSHSRKCHCSICGKKRKQVPSKTEFGSCVDSTCSNTSISYSDTSSRTDFGKSHGKKCRCSSCGNKRQDETQSSGKSATGSSCADSTCSNTSVQLSEGSDSRTDFDRPHSQSCRCSRCDKKRKEGSRPSGLSTRKEEGDRPHSKRCRCDSCGSKRKEKASSKTAADSSCVDSTCSNTSVEYSDEDEPTNKTDIDETHSPKCRCVSCGSKRKHISGSKQISPIRSGLVCSKGTKNSFQNGSRVSFSKTEIVSVNTDSIEQDSEVTVSETKVTEPKQTCICIHCDKGENLTSDGFEDRSNQEEFHEAESAISFQKSNRSVRSSKKSDQSDRPSAVRKFSESYEGDSDAISQGSNLSIKIEDEIFSDSVIPSLMKSERSKTSEESGGDMVFTQQLRSREDTERSKRSVKTTEKKIVEKCNEICCPNKKCAHRNLDKLEVHHKDCRCPICKCRVCTRMKQPGNLESEEILIHDKDEDAFFDMDDKAEHQEGDDLADFTDTFDEGEQDKIRSDVWADEYASDIPVTGGDLGDDFDGTDAEIHSESLIEVPSDHENRSAPEVASVPATKIQKTIEFTLPQVQEVAAVVEAEGDTSDDEQAEFFDARTELQEEDNLSVADDFADEWDQKVLSTPVSQIPQKDKDTVIADNAEGDAPAVNKVAKGALDSKTPQKGKASPVASPTKSAKPVSKAPPKDKSSKSADSKEPKKARTSSGSRSLRRSVDTSDGQVNEPRKSRSSSVSKSSRKSVDFADPKSKVPKKARTSSVTKSPQKGKPTPDKKKSKPEVKIQDDVQVAAEDEYADMELGDEYADIGETDLVDIHEPAPTIAERGEAVCNANKWQMDKCAANVKVNEECSANDHRPECTCSKCVCSVCRLKPKVCAALTPTSKTSIKVSPREYATTAKECVANARVCASNAYNKKSVIPEVAAGKTIANDGKPHVCASRTLNLNGSELTRHVSATESSNVNVEDIASHANASEKLNMNEDDASSDVCGTYKPNINGDDASSHVCATENPMMNDDNDSSNVCASRRDLNKNEDDVSSYVCATQKPNTDEADVTSHVCASRKKNIKKDDDASHVCASRQPSKNEGNVAGQTSNTTNVSSLKLNISEGDVTSKKESITAYEITSQQSNSYKEDVKSTLIKNNDDIVGSRGCAGKKQKSEHICAKRVKFEIHDPESGVEPQIPDTAKKVCGAKKKKLPVDGTDNKDDIELPAEAQSSVCARKKKDDQNDDIELAAEARSSVCARKKKDDTKYPADSKEELLDYIAKLKAKRMDDEGLGCKCGECVCSCSKSCLKVDKGERRSSAIGSSIIAACNPLGVCNCTICAEVGKDGKLNALTCVCANCNTKRRVLGTEGSDMRHPLSVSSLDDKSLTQPSEHDSAKEDIFATMGMEGADVLMPSVVMPKDDLVSIARSDSGGQTEELISLTKSDYRSQFEKRSSFARSELSGIRDQNSVHWPEFDGPIENAISEISTRQGDLDSIFQPSTISQRNNVDSMWRSTTGSQREDYDTIFQEHIASQREELDSMQRSFIESQKDYDSIFQSTIASQQVELDQTWQSNNVSSKQDHDSLLRSTKASQKNYLDSMQSPPIERRREYQNTAMQSPIDGQIYAEDPNLRTCYCEQQTDIETTDSFWKSHIDTQIENRLSDQVSHFMGVIDKHMSVIHPAFASKMIDEMTDSKLDSVSQKDIKSTKSDHSSQKIKWSDVGSRIPNEPSLFKSSTGSQKEDQSSILKSGTGSHREDQSSIFKSSTGSQREDQSSLFKSSTGSQKEDQSSILKSGTGSHREDQSSIFKSSTGSQREDQSSLYKSSTGSQREDQSSLYKSSTGSHREDISLISQTRSGSQMEDQISIAKSERSCPKDRSAVRCLCHGSQTDQELEPNSKASSASQKHDQISGDLSDHSIQRDKSSICWSASQTEQRTSIFDQREDQSSVSKTSSDSRSSVRFSQRQVKEVGKKVCGAGRPIYPKKTCAAFNVDDYSDVSGSNVASLEGERCPGSPWCTIPYRDIVIEFEVCGSECSSLIDNKSTRGQEDKKQSAVSFDDIFKDTVSDLFGITVPDDISLKDDLFRISHLDFNSQNSELSDICSISRRTVQTQMCCMKSASHFDDIFEICSLSQRSVQTQIISDEVTHKVLSAVTSAQRSVNTQFCCPGIASPSDPGSEQSEITSKIFSSQKSICTQVSYSKKSDFSANFGSQKTETTETTWSDCASPPSTIHSEAPDCSCCACADEQASLTNDFSCNITQPSFQCTQTGSKLSVIEDVSESDSCDSFTCQATRTSKSQSRLEQEMADDVSECDSTANDICPPSFDRKNRSKSRSQQNMTNDESLWRNCSDNCPSRMKNKSRSRSRQNMADDVSEYDSTTSEIGPPSSDRKNRSKSRSRQNKADDEALWKNCSDNCPSRIKNKSRSRSRQNMADDVSECDSIASDIHTPSFERNKKSRSCSRQNVVDDVSERDSTTSDIHKPSSGRDKKSKSCSQQNVTDDLSECVNCTSDSCPTGREKTPINRSRQDVEDDVLECGSCTSDTCFTERNKKTKSHSRQTSEDDASECGSCNSYTCSTDKNKQKGDNISDCDSCSSDTCTPKAKQMSKGACTVCVETKDPEPQCLCNKCCTKRECTRRVRNICDDSTIPCSHRKKDVQEIHEKECSCPICSCLTCSLKNSKGNYGGDGSNARFPFNSMERRMVPVNAQPYEGNESLCSDWDCDTAGYGDKQNVHVDIVLNYLTTSLRPALERLVENDSAKKKEDDYAVNLNVMLTCPGSASLSDNSSNSSFSSECGSCGTEEVKQMKLKPIARGSAPGVDCDNVDVVHLLSRLIYEDIIKNILPEDVYGCSGVISKEEIDNKLIEIFQNTLPDYGQISTSMRQMFAGVPKRNVSILQRGSCSCPGKSRQDFHNNSQVLNSSHYDNYMNLSDLEQLDKPSSVPIFYRDVDDLKPRMTSQRGSSPAPQGSQTIKIEMTPMPAESNGSGSVTVPVEVVVNSENEKPSACGKCASYESVPDCKKTRGSARGSEPRASSTRSSTARGSEVRSSSARSSGARGSEARSSGARGSEVLSSEARSGGERGSGARSSGARSSGVRSSGARSSGARSSSAQGSPKSSSSRVRSNASDEESECERCQNDEPWDNDKPPCQPETESDTELRDGCYKSCTSKCATRNRRPKPPGECKDTCPGVARLQNRRAVYPPVCKTGPPGGCYDTCTGVCGSGKRRVERAPVCKTKPTEECYDSCTGVCGSGRHRIMPGPPNQCYDSCTGVCKPKSPLAYDHHEYCRSDCDGTCKTTEVQTELALGSHMMSTSLNSMSVDDEVTEYETCDEGLESSRSMACCPKTEMPWDNMALPPTGSIRIAPISRGEYCGHDDEPLRSRSKVRGSKRRDQYQTDTSSESEDDRDSRSAFRSQSRTLGSANMRNLSLSFNKPCDKDCKENEPYIDKLVRQMSSQKVSPCCSEDIVNPPKMSRRDSRRPSTGPKLSRSKSKTRRSDSANREPKCVVCAEVLKKKRAKQAGRDCRGPEYCLSENMDDSVSFSNINPKDESKLSKLSETLKKIQKTCECVSCSRTDIADTGAADEQEIEDVARSKSRISQRDISDMKLEPRLTASTSAPAIPICEECPGGSRSKSKMGIKRTSSTRQSFRYDDEYKSPMFRTSSGRPASRKSTQGNCANCTALAQLPRASSQRPSTSPLGYRLPRGSYGNYERASVGSGRGRASESRPPCSALSRVYQAAVGYKPHKCEIRNIMCRKATCPAALLKQDPVVLAMIACEEELKPIKQALNQVQQKLRNLNMPELDCILRRPCAAMPARSSQTCKECGQDSSRSQATCTFLGQDSSRSQQTCKECGQDSSRLQQTCTVCGRDSSRSQATCTVCGKDDKPAQREGKVCCACGQDKKEEKKVCCACGQDKKEEKKMCCACGQDKKEEKKICCACSQDKKEEKKICCACSQDKKEEKKICCACVQDNTRQVQQTCCTCVQNSAQVQRTCCACPHGGSQLQPYANGNVGMFATPAMPSLPPSFSLPSPFQQHALTCDPCKLPYMSMPPPPPCSVCGAANDPLSMGALVSSAQLNASRRMSGFRNSFPESSFFLPQQEPSRPRFSAEHSQLARQLSRARSRTRSDSWNQTPPPGPYCPSCAEDEDAEEDDRFSESNVTVTRRTVNHKSWASSDDYTGTQPGKCGCEEELDNAYGNFDRSKVSFRPPRCSESNLDFGMAPSGMYPSEMAHSGFNPSGMSPSGFGPSPRSPSGFGHPGICPAFGAARFGPSVYGPAGFVAPGMSPSGFGPSGMSPSGFSPSGMSPSGFGPSGMSPSGFGPSLMSPSAMSPSGFSPSGMTPSGFGPSLMSPSGFNPSAMSPSGFSPSALSPSGFSPPGFGSTDMSPSRFGASLVSPSDVSQSGYVPGFASSRITPSGMSRSEMTSSAFVTGNMTSSEFSPSRISPTEMSRSGLVPPEMSPTEMSRSGLVPSEMSPTEMSRSGLVPSGMSPTEMSRSGLVPPENNRSRLSPTEISNAGFTHSGMSPSGMTHTMSPEMSHSEMVASGMSRVEFGPSEMSRSGMSRSGMVPSAIRGMASSRVMSMRDNASQMAPVRRDSYNDHYDPAIIEYPEYSGFFQASSTPVGQQAEFIECKQDRMVPMRSKVYFCRDNDVIINRTDSGVTNCKCGQPEPSTPCLVNRGSIVHETVNRYQSQAQTESQFGCFKTCYGVGKTVRATTSSLSSHSLSNTSREPSSSMNPHSRASLTTGLVQKGSKLSFSAQNCPFLEAMKKVFNSNEGKPSTSSTFTGIDKSFLTKDLDNMHVHLRIRPSAKSKRPNLDQ